jgi:hypothetical protein
MVGSIGPAGSTRFALPGGGFIFTRSTLPKGLGGAVPSRMYQRRLLRCSGASAVPNAIWAGRSRFSARRTPSLIRCATKRW